MDIISVDGKVSGKFIGFIVVVFMALIVGLNSYYVVDGGEFAIEQSMQGDLTPVTTPGFKAKVPFVTKVFMYPEYITITWSNQNESSASSSNMPYYVRFGDTYGGFVTGSLRFKMPTDPEKIIALHKAVKTLDNLEENTLEKNAEELLAYTAAQFTGVDFMQGGQNEYRNRILDQAEKGLYVTRRELVAENTSVAQAGVGVDNARVHVGQNAVYKNVIQRDMDGKPIRKQSALNSFGITVAQVAFAGFNPDPDLDAYAKNKRARLQERAKIVEQQQNERELAKAESAKGERERITAKQQALRAKDQAEIKAKQRLELERIAAEREKVQKEKEKALAEIEKSKELEIAKAEKAIQEAIAAATIAKAKAIREKGFAEADVREKKYAAYDHDLYMMELKRDTTISLANALKGTKIAVPEVYISGGEDGKMPNSVDTYMNAISIDQMRNLNKKVK